MTWRDHTWELCISPFAWLIALVALAGIAALVAHEAIKRRRSRGRRR